MTALPDLAAVREWVKIPVTFIPDVDLTRMYGAAKGKVASACRVPVDAEGAPDFDSEDWPDELIESILRRIQRSIAAKNLPLGYIDQSGEYGPARIPQYDVLIEELEGHLRKVVFA